MKFKVSSALLFSNRLNWWVYILYYVARGSMRIKQAAHISEFCDVAPLLSEPRNISCGFPNPDKEPLQGRFPQGEQLSYKNEDSACPCKGVCCARCQRITEPPIIKIGPNKGQPNPRACPIPDKICARTQKWAEDLRSQLPGAEPIERTKYWKEVEEKYPGIKLRTDDALIRKHLKDDLGWSDADIESWTDRIKEKFKKEVKVTNPVEFYQQYLPYMPPSKYLESYVGISDDPAWKKDMEIFNSTAGEIKVKTDELKDQIKKEDSKDKIKELKKQLDYIQWKPINWHMSQVEKEEVGQLDVYLEDFYREHQDYF